ncbi:MAG: type IV secretory system conjugative DNA transfer family protein [Candidatus Microthrix sp.]|nr:type IV secretory system conjugative DNA transfer family protein [Candidatus Microthrix sp.]MBK7021546.1 type IV secretory system conjugative DNA transfer family protein [Candidatus Microthrix sp.]
MSAANDQQRGQYTQASSALQWHELGFPREMKSEALLSFVRTLSTRPRSGPFTPCRSLICEVLATGQPTGLRWTLGIDRSEVAAVLGHLRASLPSLHLTRLSGRALPKLQSGMEVRLNPPFRPVRSDDPAGVSRGLLTAMQAVSGKEVLLLSWTIGGWLPRSANPPSSPDASIGLGSADPARAQREATAMRKAKQTEPLFGVSGRIAVNAATAGRRQQLAQGVFGALQLARQPGAGLVRRRISPRRTVRRLHTLQRPLVSWPCQLNAAELTALLGWPLGNPYLVGVSYQGGRQLPARRAALQVGDVRAGAPPRVLGEALYPSQHGQRLRLEPSDALQHLHLIGPTGSGKSALLSGLIAADIAAGRSVVVIEPKLDLIADVLTRIPRSRLDEVVLIDPTDTHFAVGLDLLGARSADPELAAEQLLHLMRELNRDSWGPRTAQLLHAGLTTLAQAGGQSLAELPLLLTDSAYRRGVLASVQDPLGVAGVWAWFDALSTAEQATVVAPSLNKIGALLGRRRIRSIVGQVAPRFDFAQVFAPDQRRIVLINLAKGVIGSEAARLLGSLCLMSVWQAALGRSAQPAAKRHPVMIFIDEFQDYVSGATADFGELLAQARGLGVGLSLAHQGLYQLDVKTKEAALTNARNRVVFGSSGAEARALATALGSGLAAADLQALQRFEAYAAILVAGNPASPASIRTLAPAPPASKMVSPSAVRTRSRQNWAKPITEIERELLAHRGHQPAAGSANPTPPPETLGVRSRRRS